MCECCEMRVSPELFKRKFFFYLKTNSYKGNMYRFMRHDIVMHDPLNSLYKINNFLCKKAENVKNKWYKNILIVKLVNALVETNRYSKIIN